MKSKILRVRQKVGLQLCVRETEFILVSSLINHCIIFHMDNCKPTFAPPCICKLILRSGVPIGIFHGDIGGISSNIIY